MKQTIIAIICFLCLSSSYIQAQKINHPSLLYTPQRIQQVKQRMQNEPKLQEAWDFYQKKSFYCAMSVFIVVFISSVFSAALSAVISPATSALPMFSAGDQ